MLVSMKAAGHAAVVCLALLASAALAMLLGACGRSTSLAQLPAHSSAASAAVTVRQAPARAPARARHPHRSRIDEIVRAAKEIYHSETNGPKLHLELRRIARNGILLDALSKGDVAGALAAAEAQLQFPLNHFAHLTRISVVRGSRVLLNATINSDGVFVVAPATHLLRLHRRTLGTLLVSIQDVTGFVKLTHRNTGAEVVARGASGRVRTTLGAAAHVRLPSSGQLTIAGNRYLVRSFSEIAWGNEPTGNEPLTVWILARV